jgi:hypothetical protein
MTARWSVSTFLVVSALFLTSCGGTETAKSGVGVFRDRTTRQAYAEIYRDAAPEFRQTTTEGEFVKFMTALDRRLGRWQSAGDPSWNVTRGTGGQTVRLTYQSQFIKGSATEQFAWRIEHGAAVLLGYHISSPLLVSE